MKKIEDRSQKSEVRRQTPEVSLTSYLLPLLGLLFLIPACATTSQKASLATPPKAESQPVARQASGNSLWQDTASLYEDNKARRLNDLVTINVIENISGSGAADTNTGKSSSVGAGITDFFGMPLSGSINGGRYIPTPTLTAAYADTFKGTGATNRSGTLLGTNTAKVVAVMPNGNLRLESKKEITINNEKQILILRGLVRPDDIAIDNTVLSSRVADAEVFFVGDGVLQEKQGPGWLGRIVSAIWPF
jgi:flagellar L-ring protein precursor FlgH